MWISRNSLCTKLRKIKYSILTIAPLVSINLQITILLISFNVLLSSDFIQASCIIPSQHDNNAYWTGTIKINSDFIDENIKQNKLRGISHKLTTNQENKYWAKIAPQEIKDDNTTDIIQQNYNTKRSNLISIVLYTKKHLTITPNHSLKADGVNLKVDILNMISSYSILSLCMIPTLQKKVIKSAFIKNLFETDIIQNSNISYNWNNNPANSRISNAGNFPKKYIAESTQYNGTVKRLLKTNMSIFPAFHHTFWLLIFLLLSVPFFVALAIKWHVNSLQKQKNDLEGIIMERNKYLLNNNQELKEKIKQNEMLHSIMVHDIKAPIFFIGSVSNEILQGWERLTKDDIRNNLDIIRQASQSINSFVVDFLTWAKHCNGSNLFEKESINVIQLINEVSEFHNNSDKIKKGRLTLVIDCPKTLQIYSNKQLIKIIIGNLLSNSIKFSSQGTITLYAHISKGKNVLIGCKDQGRGMDKVMVEQLMCKHYKGNSISKESFKMGYVFINDIIKTLNAKLYITSEIGSGTNVAVEIKA